ncbi:protein DVR-1-like [Bombina bombina]|uniref:protein DVR-1-like n=1 Tax=Bombina bombina TaxID=8345 RepID=UPI00235A550A|nr:protein DVR-1-like [Bombina bombina]
MMWLMLDIFLCVLVPVTLDAEFKRREDLFLKNLGLSSKPDPVSPPSVPPILWKIFKERMGNPSQKKKHNLCYVDEFKIPGNIIRVLPDHGKFILPQTSTKQPTLCLEKRLFFNMSVMGNAEKVTMGRLEVRFSHNTYHGNVFDLRLYRILQMSLKGMGSHKLNRKLLMAQSFRLLHKSLYFNLTEICQIWMDPLHNVGLVLEIYTRNDASRTTNALESCRDIQTFLYTSLLVVSLDSQQCRSPRKKRSYVKLPFTASNICRKRRLYVEFRDVGWQKWVIAPRGYLANYCFGECPFPLTELLNGTNHAILQTLIHSIDSEDIPLPCCVPIKMSPISMLFYDNCDNVVLRHYENMAVDECGCR